MKSTHKGLPTGPLAAGRNSSAGQGSTAPLSNSGGNHGAGASVDTDHGTCGFCGNRISGGAHSC
jgi:hypothetical protein